MPKGFQTKVKFQGKIYPTERSLADAFGIHINTFRKRLQSGCTMKQALGLKSRMPAKNAAKPITVAGTSYPSLRTAGLAHGLCYEKLMSRLHDKWTIEEAFDLVERPYAVSDECRGRVYVITNKINNLVYVGLTTRPLKQRLREHVKASHSPSGKLSRAIAKLGSRNFNIKLLAKSSSRKELVELERQYIKDYDSFKHGYNSAPGGSLGSNGRKPTKFRGKVYASGAALAWAHGIDPNKYGLRRKLGWTKAEALGFKHRKRSGNTPKPIKFRGVLYPSQRQLCKIYGTNIGAFCVRRASGASIERALFG